MSEEYITNPLNKRNRWKLRTERSMIKTGGRAGASELIDRLRPVTEEEKKILSGCGSIEKEIYTTGKGIYH